MHANKVVFCTGGGGTICSAQVQALVSLGANACIVGRNEEKTNNVAEKIASTRNGSHVLGIGNIDVRKLDSLQAAVRQCIQTLEHINYVIYGAAGNFLAPIDKLSANAFKSVVDIDLLGSYHTLKATIPHLLESAARNTNPGRTIGGRIIFISATFHFTGVPFQAHVASAKAGVDALSASVALEYGPHGVTSNVISPGCIQGTEGMERLSSKEMRESGSAGRDVPLGRYGLVKEVSDATVYLFSETGNYVNGHVLVIDGGAWRLPGLDDISKGFTYPDIVLQGADLQGDIKTGRRSTSNI
ncbi:oxidoreductase [Talaromyces proteolyticus]|uniref:2,4-dienoyl-CoA reductase [(3E)-enoyl-CoA-producing] n=1 Tax=Talaromyces proteolyticus TaxID=1131652 RepID=A0AAD4L210_9EURO|nr:oxidoreductase [Talaromyces proteolyticus]KAH8702405.1 oxidoreductase [Talaromyces proteolyticus]